MREILFRGKQKGIMNWVEGTGIFTDGINTWLSANEPNRPIAYGLKHKIVLSETVGQFTDLTDKNGKKIFEGDVVKFTDSPFGYSYIGVVCFNEGNFCIKYEYWEKEEFHRIGQTDKWQDMGASGTVTYQYEILGNIHDNPELLETP